MKPPDNLLTLADRLKAARAAKHLSQPELAQRSGLSQSQISNLETGRSYGSKNIVQLAHALGVNSVWLASGRGPRDLDANNGGGDADLFAALYPEDALFPTRPAQPIWVLGPMTEIPDRLAPLPSARAFADKGWTVIEGVAAGGEPGSAPIPREYAFVASNDPQAFLTRVSDTEEAMQPVYAPGSYVLIEPSTRAEISDDVLVRLNDGRTLLRRLARQDDRHLTLQAFQPPGSLMTLRLDDVRWVYPVAHPVPAKRIRQNR